MLSGSIAAILPELDLRIVLAVLPQCCQKGLLRQYSQKLICMRNPAAIVRICCSNITAILRQYCCNIAAIYCQKPCILVRGSQVDQVVQQEPDTDIVSLLKQVDQCPPVKQELDPETCPVPIPADNYIPVPGDVNISSMEPPKKRFKETTQDCVEELISNNAEISTKRSTKWAVSTLKGMYHSLSFSILIKGCCL